MLNYEVVFEIWVLEKDNFSIKTLYENMDYLSPFTENMFLKKEKKDSDFKTSYSAIFVHFWQKFFEEISIYSSTVPKCKQSCSTPQKSEIVKNKKSFESMKFIQSAI